MELLYKNDVANLTYEYLGTNYEIIDVDNEQTNQAIIFRRNYRSHLKGWLEKHEWNFATDWKALARENSSTDISGYEYVYGYPADACAIRQLATEECFKRGHTYDEYNVPYSEVMRSQSLKILTDLDDAWAEYTVMLNEDDGMPSHFAKGLAAYIAMEIAPAVITENFTKVMRGLDLERQLNKRMGEAMAIDLSRVPPRKDPESPFVQARRKSSLRV